MTPEPGSGRLIAREVRKAYGDILVLDGLNLEVAPGETFALLGPSGCGKSTLLRLLAGFEAANSGSITVDDEPVLGPSPARGMVAQAGTLFPWLTVRQNIGFGPRERGDPDAAATVAELLAVTGLTDFADSLPRQLSGGMRQRASLAQVLANRPPILLMDEPFGALDAQTRLRMHEWVRGLLADRPTTAVLVTHDVDEALLLGDRLGMLTPRPSVIRSIRTVPFGTERGRHTFEDPQFAPLRAEILDEVLSLEVAPSQVMPAR